jgi:hypothetical protein
MAGRERSGVEFADPGVFIGANYIVTIVMKDQVNPSYSDADGLARVSKEFLDYKDVEYTVKNDASAAKLVKAIDGTITYKDYTIVAKMNSQGQFIEITHYGVGYIDADLTLVAGTAKSTGSLASTARYYDFKY